MTTPVLRLALAGLALASLLAAACAPPVGEHEQRLAAHAPELLETPPRHPGPPFRPFTTPTPRP